MVTVQVQEQRAAATMHKDRRRAGREGAPFAADTATEHARPTDAVARRAVQFGEGNAEGRGSGSGQLTSRLPAGAKQKEAAHGGAPPTTRST